MTTAVIVLMFITSMGIFGFLSKAHNDQNLVSGDVVSKIAIYDEKIKTAKDNIDANRKQLKQMDEAVDQVMGRSSDEKGADKAVALRKGQAKDRARLLQDIQAEQKTISSLNEERAPIAAEVRKVEAEVGPIKYIAQFVYGSNPDSSILEKAVTWIIILIVIVFDPLAVILLLASQISFQSFREKRDWLDNQEDELNEAFNVVESPKEQSEEINLEWKEAGPEPKYEQDDGPLTEKQIEEIKETVQFKDPGEHPSDTLQYEILEDVDDEPVNVGPAFEGVKIDGEWIQTGPSLEKEPEQPSALDQWNTMIAEVEKNIQTEQQADPPRVDNPTSDYVVIDGERFHKRAVPAGYIQNEEQQEGGKWQEITKATKITEQEYLEKAKANREESNPNNPA
jgi:Tfp pilus assembly protein PilO